MKKSPLYNTKTMLVTGGAGFIGSHFIAYMLKYYPMLRIINFDKLTYAANLENLAPFEHDSRYQFVQGDICNGDAVATVFEEYLIDTVVHFAAESHVDNSITGPDVFIETNIIGTHTLLKAALQSWSKQFQLDPARCRFHHISTDEVYGSLSKEDPPFTEESTYKPNSPYSASKAASDHIVRAYYKTYGLPITISNCSNNYGANQHDEKFIPTVINACIAQMPIPIYNDGSNIRDWIYADDHACAVASILEQGVVGETYNIGSECELSNLAIAKLICNKADVLFPEHRPHLDLISFVKDRPGHDWRYAINCEKLRQQTGWEPKFNFSPQLDILLAKQNVKAFPHSM